MEKLNEYAKADAAKLFAEIELIDSTIIDYEEKSQIFSKSSTTG